MTWVHVKLFNSYIGAALPVFARHDRMRELPQFSDFVAWRCDRVISNLELSCVSWVLYSVTTMGLYKCNIYYTGISKEAMLLTRELSRQNSALTIRQFHWHSCRSPRPCLLGRQMDALYDKAQRDARTNNEMHNQYGISIHVCELFCWLIIAPRHTYNMKRMQLFGILSRSSIYFVYANYQNNYWRPHIFFDDLNKDIPHLFAQHYSWRKHLSIPPCNKGNIDTSYRYRQT